MGSGDLDAQATPLPPGDGGGRADQAGIEQNWVVGAPGDAHGDGIFGDGHARGGIEEAPEELAGPGALMAPEGLGEEAIDPAPDDGEEDIEMTFRATAEDSASRWKKSMLSASPFSISIRWA